MTCINRHKFSHGWAFPQRNPNNMENMILPCLLSLLFQVVSSEDRVCENGGTKISLNRCKCKPGYTGAYCQRSPRFTELLRRWRSRCQPGTRDIETNTCICQSGWTGRNCDRCASGHSGPNCTEEYWKFHRKLILPLPTRRKKARSSRIGIMIGSIALSMTGK